MEYLQKEDRGLSGIFIERAVKKEAVPMSSAVAITNSM
jgi:hypothetical protein